MGERGAMIADCQTNITNCSFCKQTQERTLTKNLFLWAVKGIQSWGSFRQIICPVAMALMTHRKSNAQREKWDLSFNCCVCCCCFPGLIYSLAAVGQLLKHLIYSDVFVSCLEWCISLIILCRCSLRLSISAIKQHSPLYYCGHSHPDNPQQMCNMIHCLFLLRQAFILVLCLCPCLSREFCLCPHNSLGYFLPWIGSLCFMLGLFHGPGK